MKKINFKSTTKNEAGELIFEGSYQIEMPKFTERLKIVQELDSLRESGNANTDALALACHMAELSEKYICGMNLKHVESGEEFNSFEELEYCEEVGIISSEVFKHLTKGKSLGKS